MWETLDTSIEGLKIITPFISKDQRGNFVKVFEESEYSQLGFPNNISETFISLSKPHVVRGLHFQYRNPQTKYVSVLSGRVFDVAVDLRRDSPTFGQWQGIELNDTNHYVFYIPVGFAHGFQVLGENDAIVMYQCCGKYDKGSDSGIKWNDKEIRIVWPEFNDVIISDRDASLSTLADFKEQYRGL